MEPFALSPVLVERPWGGRRLERYGKRLPPDVAIGESWEVADLPDGVAVGVDDPKSRVASGPHTGTSLGALARRHPQELFGAAAPPEGEFPLLVKLLDAREHLSVQVHPHSRFAAGHPEVRLKTESWYVVDAEPDSVLFLDLVSGTDLVDVERALGSGDVVELLRTVPARPGDFHHLPAGLVHALGAGVMVAEVQTPSDTTFRIYDWAEEYRRSPRPLHTAEALETILVSPEGFESLDAVSGEGSRTLVETDHYLIHEHRAGSGPTAVDYVGNGALKVCMVVGGSATFGSLEVGRGTTVVVPAMVGPVLEMGPGAVVLEVGLPDSGG